MRKIAERILDVFKVGDSHLGGSKSDKLTNKVLFRELVAHFSSELEELSVEGRMLYPMAFNVLMHPDDYGPREESLPFVLPEVVSRFYKIIKERQSNYPDIRPPATSWVFQFSACELKEIEGRFGENKIIEKGKIMTTASLMTFDLSANITTETNIRFSIKPQNSDPSRNRNINMEAIRNIEFRGNSTFSFAFDKNLDTNATTIMANSEVASMKGLATLTYSKGGNKVHYDIRDNLIHISGNKDARKDRFVFKLDSDKISDSHVQIRHLPAESKFQIAAFGETRLNGRKVEPSEGGTLKWYDLANNSQIFMNDAVAVEFKINR